MESVWLASSHHLAGMTCAGDGVSTGCHDNGHGSDKASMKAPFTGTTPDEEAFCYGCHDTDGPGIDIESQFSGTLTASPGSGSILNMHHDVSDSDQAYSGAVLECNNCHDPHSATPAQPHLGNIDTGDGRDPAPGNTFTGSTLTTEFCFECHDNSYPASVTPPTVALSDLYDLWVSAGGGGDAADQHGPADAAKNVSLRAGSGYVQGDILNCEACHELGHGSTDNLFQLKTTIYSKDGSTPLVSDTGDTLVYVTNLDPSSTDILTNGQNWCSTCHPNPMGGNKDKDCIGCHYHGDRF
jgi:predicted CXXCH cytochrome family protein